MAIAKIGLLNLACQISFKSMVARCQPTAATTVAKNLNFELLATNLASSYPNFAYPDRHLLLANLGGA